MNPNVFLTFAQRLGVNFQYIGLHVELKQFFISEMIHSVLKNHHPSSIVSFKIDLPYHGFQGNLFQLQGGGNYNLLEIDFQNGQKDIIQILHVFEQQGAIPRTQKFGNLIDYMARLKVLQQQPKYANAQLYEVFISDAVMLNYMDGIVFNDHIITPAFIAAQRNAFQEKILPASLAYIQNNPAIEATIVNSPIYGNAAMNFGVCTWQIS